MANRIEQGVAPERAAATTIPTLMRSIDRYWPTDFELNGGVARQERRNKRNGAPVIPQSETEDGFRRKFGEYY